MINVCILGATGSIGKQAIEVINSLKDYQVVSVSCNKNVDKLLTNLPTQVKDIAITGEVNVNSFNIPPHIKIYKGEKSLEKIISKEYVDIVINAISGYAGLDATILAIRNHKRLLLANKESLVMAGDIVNKELFNNAGVLIPIDSEHSALRECLIGKRQDEVDFVTITASGGALRDKSRDELDSVTLSEVLLHPTWEMGAKITIDSATMVNKGFEVIEAHHLFHLPYEKIGTIIHKESYVHAFASFSDGLKLMVKSAPDMKMPIKYALTGESEVEPILVTKENLDGLTFEEMDFDRFPMLALAYEVGSIGGILPAVYCISNDCAVKLFMEGKIKFLEIEEIITREVNYYYKHNIINPTLDDIKKLISEITHKLM